MKKPFQYQRQDCAAHSKASHCSSVGKSSSPDPPLFDVEEYWCPSQGTPERIKDALGDDEMCDVS